jgi:hypothetical protein
MSIYSISVLKLFSFFFLKPRREILPTAAVWASITVSLNWIILRLPCFFFFLYYVTLVARLKVLKGKYTPRVMIKRDKKKGFRKIIFTAVRNI